MSKGSTSRVSTRWLKEGDLLESGVNVMVHPRFPEVIFVAVKTPEHNIQIKIDTELKMITAVDYQ